MQVENRQNIRNDKTGREGQLFSFLSPSLYGQFHKSLSLSASANFNFKTTGLALNDAGFGVDLNASLFSKNKLQLLLESSADRFIGDKLFIAGGKGRENENPVFYNLPYSSFGHLWTCMALYQGRWLFP